MILYRGPSVIDHKPIVVIATGYDRRSKNSKTGDMVQVWILCADQSPISSVMDGKDSSICGDCRHRGPLGNRSCYVNLGKAPTNIWGKFQRGGYEVCHDLSVFGAGKLLRLGAYGDPGAVPGRIWQKLLKNAKGWTGYTHLWRSRPDLLTMCMASVDTLSEQSEAQAKGWRTFRTTTELLMRPTEIFCPASEEMKKKTTCEKCQLCNGTATMAKNIAIMIHGVGKQKYAE